MMNYEYSWMDNNYEPFHQLFVSFLWFEIIRQRITNASKTMNKLRIYEKFYIYI